MTSILLLLPLVGGLLTSVYAWRRGGVDLRYTLAGCLIGIVLLFLILFVSGTTYGFFAVPPDGWIIVLDGIISFSALGIVLFFVEKVNRPRPKH